MRNTWNLHIILFFASTMGSSCGRLIPGSSDDEDVERGQLEAEAVHLTSLETYKNCEDLKGRVKSDWEEFRANQSNRDNDEVPTAVGAPANSASNNTQSSPAAGAGIPESATSSGSKQSTTNVQEQGIDEADMLKVNKSHIFTRNRGGIHVMDRASFKELSLIKTTDLIDPILYAYDNRLVVIGYKSDGAGITLFRSYSGDAGQDLKLEKERSFKGSIMGSRLVDKRLIMVLNSQMPFEQSSHDEMGKITIAESNQINDVPCERIIRAPSFRGQYPSYALQEIITVQTDKPDSSPEVTGAHDGGAQIYMGQKNLYLFKMSWNYSRFSRPFLSQNYTIITKVGFEKDSGKPIITSSGAVPGHTKDQWAFHEMEDQNFLAVATTESPTMRTDPNGRPTLQNNLFILEQKSDLLAVKSKVAPYGLNEDIRAVRYVGSMAYVVTFRRTDPLFAFDLSDTANPVLLGDLKVPGFSVYMHPLSKDRMIGVGFDATEMGNTAIIEGLQLSLFDVSNSKDLKRIDNHIIGAKGSHSDATSDHHAFLFDPTLKILALPVVELEQGSNDPMNRGYNNILKFSGAVIYESGDQAIKEVSRISHKDLISAKCANGMKYGQWWQGGMPSFDINRIISLDDHLISVSRFGIKRHGNKAPFETATTIKFADPDQECTAIGYDRGISQGSPVLAE